jgi:hypothetical protein
MERALIAREATATPFQPVAPTATSLPAQTQQLRDALQPTPTPQPTAAPTPTREPLTGVWRGIDFNDTTRRIELTIQADSQQLNGGRALHIGFRPGRPCAYINFTACIGLHESEQSSIILATVHSGIGGDGQALRHALEGTGFNQAAFRLDEIQRQMDALHNAQVSIQQGAFTASELRVRAAARVPPDQLDAYFSSPVTEALARLAETDADLAKALKSRRPLLVIETCGWRNPQEAGLPGATDTTGAVYLLVIQ